MARCGVGTGALSETILSTCDPASLLAIDPSEGFVSFARQQIPDSRASFRTGEAGNIPADSAAFDLAVSGLVLNFVPEPQAAFAEMLRVVKPGGKVAFHVWDYPGGGMGFIDAFWKVAARRDPKAESLDEGTRFPICAAEPL